MFSRNASRSASTVPSARSATAIVVHLLARVVERLQVLGPVLGPGDRSPEPDRAERDQEVLGIELAAAAEAAADVELDEPDSLLLPAEQLAEDPAVGVDDLGRPPDGQPAVLVVDLGAQPPRLERHRAVALAAKPLLDDKIGRGERGVDVSALGRPFRRDVRARCAGAAAVPPGSRRERRIEHRFERLVPDVDQLERVLGTCSPSRRRRPPRARRRTERCPPRAPAAAGAPSPVAGTCALGSAASRAAARRRSGLRHAVDARGRARRRSSGSARGRAGCAGFAARSAPRRLRSSTNTLRPVSSRRSSLRRERTAHGDAPGTSSRRRRGSFVFAHRDQGVTASTVTERPGACGARRP